MRHSVPTSLTLIAVVALLASFIPGPAAATTVAFPELAGVYEWDPSAPPNFGAPGVRSHDFVLPEGITEIEQLTFLLSGEWAVGEVACDTGFEEPGVSPFLPPISMYITSSAFPGDFFYATIAVPDGPFENLTTEFTSCCPGGVLDFNQLIGSDLQAEIILDIGIVGLCWVTADTYGTLDEVSLQITGPVPTERTSWAGVKGLYR